MDPDYFLGEGEFTERDGVVSTLADCFRWGEKEFRLISDYLKHELKFIGFTQETFRKRTASEIIRSRESTGCTDTALVFLVLARELGIPAKFVDTLSQNWIERPERVVKGHVFTDLFVNGRWRKYEPVEGFIERKDYVLDGKIYVPFGKGLDFSELYPENAEQFGTLPERVDSVDKIAFFARGKR